MFTLTPSLRNLAMLGMALGAAALPAMAQKTSSAASVALTATLPELLTIGATPNTVNFPLVSGAVAAGNNPITITTTWVLAPNRANVYVDAFFSNPAAALVGVSTQGGANIPASAVLGSVTPASGTATAFAPFTATTPLGTGLQVFSQALTTGTRAATRTDALALQVSLTDPTLSALIGADSYAGTLTIQAQAL